jgi:hypothetical protein
MAEAPEVDEEGLRQQVHDIIQAEAAADITALDGATEPPDPGRQCADAGEFAARWNAHTPEDRDEWVRNVNRALQEASTCFTMNHVRRIEMLEAQNAILRGPDSDERDALITDPILAALREWRTRAEKAEAQLAAALAKIGAAVQYIDDDWLAPFTPGAPGHEMRRILTDGSADG